MPFVLSLTTDCVNSLRLQDGFYIYSGHFLFISYFNPDLHVLYSDDRLSVMLFSYNRQNPDDHHPGDKKRITQRMLLDNYYLKTNFSFLLLFKKSRKEFLKELTL